MLEFAQHAYLALHIADRNQADIQVARFRDDAIIGTAAALDQMQRAHPATGLGHNSCEDQVAPERRPGSTNRLPRNQHRGQAGFHIQRAQAVDHPIINLGREGIVTPLVAPEDIAIPVAGIGVAAEHQRGTAAISAQHADRLMGDAAVAQGHFLQLDIVAALRHPVGQPAPDLAFPPQERRDADQLPRQVDGFMILNMLEDRGHQLVSASTTAQTSNPT